MWKEKRNAKEEKGRLKTRMGGGAGEKTEGASGGWGEQRGRAHLPGGSQHFQDVPALPGAWKAKPVSLPPFHPSFLFLFLQSPKAKLVILHPSRIMTRFRALGMCNVSEVQRVYYLFSKQSNNQITPDN